MLQYSHGCCRAALGIFIDSIKFIEWNSERNSFGSPLSSLIQDDGSGTDCLNSPKSLVE